MRRPEDFHTATDSNQSPSQPHRKARDLKHETNTNPEQDSPFAETTDQAWHQTNMISLACDVALKNVAGHLPVVIHSGS